MRYWGPAGSRATIVNNYIWKVLAITSLFRWAGDGEISDKQQGVCATHRDQTFDTPKFWDPVYSHDVNIYHQHHYFSSSSPSKPSGVQGDDQVLRVNFIDIKKKEIERVRKTIKPSKFQTHAQYTQDVAKNLKRADMKRWIWVIDWYIIL